MPGRTVAEPVSRTDDFIRTMFQCVRDPAALDHYVRARLENLSGLAGDVQWFEVTVEEHSCYGFRALVTGYRQNGNVIASHDNGNEFLAVRNACELLASELRSACEAPELQTTSPPMAPMWAAEPASSAPRITSRLGEPNDD